MNNRRLLVGLPIAILVIGVVATVLMFKSRAPVATRPPEEYTPLVRVISVEPTTHELIVRTNGTVKPRTETALVSEVAGRVLSVAPTFAEGGFFEKGDVLVSIDPRDYELAVVTAEGLVAQARVRAELERAQAAVAREEWEELGDGEESPLATREFQLQEAEASLAAAEASLEQARRNLDRTRVRAPFAGRVRDKMVDVGQYLSPGVPCATVFAVDYVEVRLPVPDSELAYLDIPINYRGDKRTKPGPDVRFHADFAGGKHTWEGEVVRVEGEIDPVSRMVHVIAQVQDPYGRSADRDPMPMAVGLFVEAELIGRTVDNVFLLPRSALRDKGKLLVVDDEERLRFRDVDVLKSDRQQVVIADGLNAGDRVCISLLDAVSDGMKVRVASTGAEAGSIEIQAEGTK